MIGYQLIMMAGLLVGLLIGVVTGTSAISVQSGVYLGKNVSGFGTLWHITRYFLQTYNGAEDSSVWSFWMRSSGQS